MSSSGRNVSSIAATNARKLYEVRRLEQIDGVWTAIDVVMSNDLQKTRTELVVTKARLQHRPHRRRLHPSSAGTGPALSAPDWLADFLYRFRLALSAFVMLGAAAFRTLRQHHQHRQRPERLDREGRSRLPGLRAFSPGVRRHAASHRRASKHQHLHGDRPPATSTASLDELEQVERVERVQSLATANIVRPACGDARRRWRHRGDAVCSRIACRAMSRPRRSGATRWMTH